MGLNGCCTCVKYLMVVLNFLFWIIGLSFIVCSVWMLTDPTFLLSMTQPTNDYYIALYIFLAVGCFILIGAFLGCCGAFKESQCLLVSFFCVLLVVLVAQLAAGAWAFHNKEKLEETVRNSVKYSVQEEYGIIHTRTVTFDSFQRNLQCCGANGPNDWAASKYNNVDRSSILNIALSNANPFFSIPESCCNEKFTQNECDLARSVKAGNLINPTIYQTGCIDKVVELLEIHWTIILSVTIFIVFLEILALVLSLSLCCAIKNDHYKG
ncbi:CD81 antigen isoform X1 [Condylostylus longicornis]|uniref:CD81 antigen isoform X1 n=2 Tax=Condylostylus longicornis TaxID=2530218 RepID=UPI00244DAD4C|nr:CD81 antigen isoform X1 [Condylostylus longicornis]